MKSVLNVAKFIARRYFKAKKSRNVINLITLISVVGITISTSALVILLSAFNGIEEMVIKLYSEFDAPISVRSKKAKTFDQHFLPLEELSELSYTSSISRAVEEVVILKYDQKWIHAKMLGVDSSFLEMTNMQEHLVDGDAMLFYNDRPSAIFGASLLDKLHAYIPYGNQPLQQITFHVPLREGKIRPGKKPLSIERIPAVARMNFNREVNAEYVVIPIKKASEMLQYGDDISALFIDIERSVDLNRAKRAIQEIVGNDFEVKTHFEKNELIFKTSQTERLIVFFILVFIFILSSFNLIASIVMLFVEKKNDIKTLRSFGATSNTIFRIFFYEGLMISGRGVLLGLILGYSIVIVQLNFGLLEMPGTGGEFFPMKPTFKDGFIIFSAVSLLGILVSYLPSKYLVKKAG